MGGRLRSYSRPWRRGWRTTRGRGKAGAELRVVSRDVCHQRVIYKHLLLLLLLLFLRRSCRRRSPGALATRRSRARGRRFRLGQYQEVGGGGRGAATYPTPPTSPTTVEPQQMCLSPVRTVGEARGEVRDLQSQLRRKHPTPAGTSHTSRHVGLPAAQPH